MKSIMRRVWMMDPQHKANGTAFAIALFAITFLQLERAPRPAGADTLRIASTKSAPVVVVAKSPEASSSDETLSPEQRTEKGIRRKIEILEKGIAFLENTPDYTAQFSKQELVNGVMLDEQTMFMKMQHSPFSVYMKWLDFDEGREVIYVDGSNDGKMIVHAGGWKARLPPLSIAPDSSLALAESRHPITNVGLLNLAKKIVAFHKQDIEKKCIIRCEEAGDQVINDRDCLCFVTEYRDAKVSKDYRKSVTFIDKELSLPIFIKNYGWASDDSASTDDESTLIEQYSYSNVKFRATLTAMDFDRTNEDYSFKR